jgi:hypothetical protein
MRTVQSKVRKGRDYLGNKGMDGEDNIKIYLAETTCADMEWI